MFGAINDIKKLTALQVHEFRRDFMMFSVHDEGLQNQTIRIQKAMQRMTLKGVAEHDLKEQIEKARFDLLDLRNAIHRKKEGEDWILVCFYHLCSEEGKEHLKSGKYDFETYEIIYKYVLNTAKSITEQSQQAEFEKVHIDRERGNKLIALFNMVVKKDKSYEEMFNKYNLAMMKKDALIKDYGKWRNDVDKAFYEQCSAIGEINKISGKVEELSYFKFKVEEGRARKKIEEQKKANRKNR